MLGDTLTFTLNGPGGTAKVLSKINQDKYSSEYLLRESNQEFRARFRHTNTVSKTGVGTDRHNVELTQTIFATSTSPAIVRKAYAVTNVQVGDDLALNTDLAQALVYWLTEANILKLSGWES